MKKFYLPVLLIISAIFASSAQNVVYTPLFNDNTFDRTLVTTLAVGSTTGQGGVSGNGGATYSIPIAVPPGTNNVVPSISIDYNSQAGSGIVGMGWNISGLSVITRSAKNIYFDGEAAPAELNSNDRFALDGNRLISKTGTYGSDNSTYGTEIEDFSTITSKGTFGNGPMWFEVVTKDGVIMEYGNTQYSRFKDDTGISVLYWRLNRIKYPDGNYIDYDYTSGDRDSRLTAIRYTGNTLTNQDTYNVIEFAYKIRQEVAPGTFSDIRTTYDANSSMVSKYLLDMITVKAEGTMMKKYQFDYGNDMVNSYLKSVTEFGSDNTRLNPTIFKYGNAPVEITDGGSFIPGADIQAFSGDFDGDGKSEILSAHESFTDQDIPYFDSFTVYKANANGNGYTAISTQSLPNRYTIVNDIKIPNSKNFIPNDFTGDGIDDILVLNISANGTESKLDNVILYQTTNGGVSFTAGTPRTIQPNYFRIPSSKQFFYTGDFDGDGISEYISILGNTLGTYLPFICTNYIVGGACGSVTTTGSPNIPSNTWHNAGRISTLDFNGDGKTDLLIESGGIYEIFTLQGQTAIKLAGGSLPSGSDLNFIGDFNGDGKTDLLYTNNNFTNVTKVISTGNTLVPSTFTMVQTWPVAADEDINIQANKFIIGDFNGDGRSDIYFKWERNIIWPNPVAGNDIHLFWGADIYYSRGNSFRHKQVDYHHEVYEGMGRPSTVTFIRDIPMDLNGDGRTDLVTWGGGSISYKLLNKDGSDNLLNKVSNGLNHVTEWKYKSLVGNGTFYIKGSGTSSYPLNIVTPGINLVYDFVNPNGIGGNATIRYNYQGVRMHRAGKGFLGFSKVISFDLTTGIRSVSENEFNTSYFTAVPKRFASFLDSDNTLISETILTNAFVSPATKRFWVKTTGISENKSLQGILATTSNIYDNANGNITQSTVNNGVESIITNTEYGDYVTDIKNRPTSVSSTTTRTGQPAYSINTTYGYNTLGQLTTQTSFSGTPSSVTTTFGYNNLGNRTSTTVSPTGMTSRTTSSTYDGKGRYPLTSLNELSQTSSATYHPVYGKPQTTTGIDGLTTTFVYNGFGQLTSTTNPGPYTVNQSYGWDQTNGAVWFSLLSYPDQGKPDEKIWYDVLGREIRSQTEGFGGNILQSKSYDAKGNLLSSTEPYKAGETYVTVTNRFNDSYNRLTSVERKNTNNVDLGTTNLSYSYSSGNLTVTSVAPSGTSSKVTDASGKAISVTDNGGTLNYTYYSHGGLNTVSNGNTVLTTSEYDEYGKQTKLIDANAGTTTYNYDALGQLTGQINANGGTHTMAYNLLGQITSRTGPEGTTSYLYGTTNTGGESKNQIKQVTGFATGNSTSYTYDALGRILTMNEKIDNLDNITSYTYNVFGDVLTTTYPSSLIITNQYDTNGYLQKIKRGSKDLYTTTSSNGQGQVTAYSLGNTKSSINTYVNGFPTKFETEGIQDLRMVWDYRKENLTSRFDARSTVNKTESFTYDNLDRLLSATVTASGGSTTTTNTTYTSNGNIATKSDAGTYTYDARKFNAVIGVTNPAPSPIPVLQQSITYTAFMQPNVVTENGYELAYNYGADYQRIKSVTKLGTTTINSRTYLSGYDKDVKNSVSRYIHYIATPVGLSAIIVIGSGIDSTHYTYTDHLGSIVAVTNSAGTIEAQQSFDAWGRRRNATSWALSAPTTATGLPVWLYRGYTGHEHLDLFGLINMNGRMYDPVLGRMLSPDNYVQEPGMTQSFNRYAYAMNNPLIYTDPDGNFWHIVIGAAIGGVVNWATHGAQFNAKGLGYFGVGAAAGALAAGIGAGVNVAMANGSFAAGFAGTASGVASTGFVSGAATGISAGFSNGLISGTGNSLLGGNSLGASLKAGLHSGVTQGLIGGLSGGLVGGIDALTKSLDFWGGTARLNTSGGVGAHGNIPDGQILGKHVGKFEGVDVYESAQMETGAGITLPGRGITVSPGAFSKQLDMQLIGHEFGHSLQIRELGGITFLKDVGFPSVRSAAKIGVNGWNHNEFWTEVWANRLSHSYFKYNFNLTKLGHWNWARFPLQYKNAADALNVLKLLKR